MLAGQVDAGSGSYNHTIELQPKGKQMEAVVVLNIAPGEAEVVSAKMAGNKALYVTALQNQIAGLTDRIACASGDLRRDSWPTGADLILLSYIVSCYEPQAVQALLARTHAYLPSGGRLLLHDFALVADRSGPHNAALFLFGQLSASAQTQAYTVDELGAAMQEAGYVDVAMLQVPREVLEAWPSACFRGAATRWPQARAKLTPRTI